MFPKNNKEQAIGKNNNVGESTKTDAEKITCCITLYVTLLKWQNYRNGESMLRWAGSGREEGVATKGGCVNLGILVVQTSSLSCLYQCQYLGCDIVLHVVLQIVTIKEKLGKG